jgi:hypothetical protein
MDLAFGQYTPDQASLDNPGSNLALNTVPKTLTSFGPLNSLQSFSDALSNRAQGAYAMKDPSGAVFTFSADSDDLFRLSGTTWNNVSKSSGAYTVGEEDHVEFTQFGARCIAAMGHTDALQSYVTGTSSAFADLSAGAPKAKHIATVRDFVVVGNCENGGTTYPNRIWWSAINDPTDWPTIGSADAASKQSDYQDLPEGGALQRIVPSVGGNDAIIIMENTIYRMVYEGPPTVFGFYPIEQQRGTVAPQSVVTVGRLAFFLDEDGFYRFDGASSTPIGAQRVDVTFSQAVEESYFYRMTGAADPSNNLVMWSYVGKGSLTGTPDKLLIYNWELDRWSHGEVELDMLARDLTAGFTLDQLDAFGTMETLPYSLDSKAWKGGRLILSAFTTDKKLGRFEGAPLDATIETPEFGGKRVFVKAIRPYVDGGTVTTLLRTRDTPSGTLSDTSSRAVDADGQSHFTTSTRYARARVKITGDWSHAQGIDFDADQDGEL